MIRLLEELNELLVNIFTVGVQSISVDIIEDIKLNKENCGRYKLTVIEEILSELLKSIEESSYTQMIDNVQKLSICTDILFKKVSYDKLINKE